MIIYDVLMRLIAFGLFRPGRETPFLPTVFGTVKQHRRRQFTPQGVMRCVWIRYLTNKPLRLSGDLRGLVRIAAGTGATGDGESSSGHGKTLHDVDSLLNTITARSTPRGRRPTWVYVCVWVKRVGIGCDGRDSVMFW